MNDKNIIMELNYVYCFLLSSYADIVGYRGGAWEFIDKKPDMSNDLVFQFISLGGFLGINVINFQSSDDTVMHLATAHALLSKFKSSKELIDNMVKEYVKSFDDMDDRGPGITTKESIDLIKAGTKWNKLPYNTNGGGSGGSMRAMCIGLAYHKPDDLDKLIAISIESGRITHNNAIGYLGALVSALFTSYAVQRIKPEKWVFNLLELLNSKKIDNYLKKTERDLDAYEKDKYKYIIGWEKYVSLRFDDNKNFIQSLPRLDNDPNSNKLKHLIYPNIRSKWYNDNFHLSNDFNPGSNGLDSCIIAYDCLLDGKDNWEKVFIHSSIHAGDNDTTGTIACAWYGTYYGNVFRKKWAHIFDQILHDMEFKSELLKTSRKLYKKYYENKKIDNKKAK